MRIYLGLWLHFISYEHPESYYQHSQGSFLWNELRTTSSQDNIFCHMLALTYVSFLKKEKKNLQCSSLNMFLDVYLEEFHVCQMNVM